MATRKTSPQPALGARAKQAQDTRGKILKAAIKVFAKYGYEGGRVERISTLAKSYDRMIYYYFGSKEKLFVEVLETIYSQFNEAEQALEATLDREDPARALSQLADFAWDYYLTHPEYVALLTSENLSQGKHAKKSSRLREISSYALSVLEAILEQGVRQRVFRPDVRARDVYLLIASLGYFYNSNHHTLSAFLGENLMDEAALLHWREVIQYTVLSATRLPPSLPATAGASKKTASARPAAR
jgi:AcrR family transcriptional regulator